MNAKLLAIGAAVLLGLVSLSSSGFAQEDEAAEEATEETAEEATEETEQETEEEGAAEEESGDEEEYTATDFALNNATLILYHELGHMFIGEFGLPVLGKAEDAADNLATLMLIEGGEEWADDVLVDSAQGWYLSPFNGPNPPSEGAFIDEHSLDKQRAYSIVCLMVGSNAEYYSDIADVYGLDADRRSKCDNIYKLTSWSWNSLLEPRLLGEQEQIGNITINYEDAGDYAAEATSLSDSNLLEDTVELVLSKYLIPRDLTFVGRQCGQANAFYSYNEGAVILCYEFIRYLEELYAKVPDEAETAETAEAEPAPQAGSVEEDDEEGAEEVEAAE